MANFSEQQKHGRAIDRAFLLEKIQTLNSVLLESSLQDDLNKKNLLFTEPIEILTATTLDEIPAVFEKIEKFIAQKKFIAGYFTYECGYHFEKIVPSFESKTLQPLLWLGIYEAAVAIPKETLDSIEHLPVIIQNPNFKIDKKDYAQKIFQLKDYITNGDTYQVNFTDRFEFETKDSAIDLYFSLRNKQHVPYSALVNTEFGHILSFSPELFFRCKEKSITTKPMKGTCRRGKTLQEDDELSSWLYNDEKNRSENLMIVDLLRNDIGRICESGSVQVTNMFAVERYETVLQMTSTVIGKLKENISYYEIFKSLFPCGSVTGAPKIRTMQIIHEQEQHQRGVYCGAIGYFSPNDETVFNVGIRTIEVHNNIGTMGVGSGIVFDSIPEKEFEECTLKANFLLSKTPDFQLLETLLWNGNYAFLRQHLDRLESSAEYFFIFFDKKKIIEALDTEQKKFQRGKQYRIRFLYSRDGNLNIESKEFIPTFSSSMIKIAEERSNSNDPFYFHKTTFRPLYDKYFHRSIAEKVADYIFLNERNEITEGTYTNIFVKKNNELLTPPISSGLLDGIYRRYLLETMPNAKESVLYTEDIQTADEIYLCNSVRGMHRVTL